MRYSSQRERVYEAIKGVNRHLSAEEVYLEVNKQEPKIGMATVYRNLNFLVENNLIVKLHVQDQQHLYDGNADKHYHLQCQECLKYYDIPITYMEQLDSKIEALCQFEIEGHNLTFKGTCAECLNKKKGEN